MHTFPIDLGGGRTAAIPSLVPVRQAIIPATMTRVRPGNRIVPRAWCQHENGNPRHDADDERRYFHLGAEGRQASYHFVADDTEVIQLIPLNENAWHAGDNLGPGNMASIAGSIAQGARDMARARAVMEHLAAGVMATLGIPGDATRQHYDFAPNRKNCPAWMRRDGYWPTFQANVRRLVETATGNPVPVWAKPFPLPYLDITGLAPARLTNADGVDFIFVGDRVRATVTTARRQWAGSTAPRVGPDILPGEEFDVDWLFANGEGWWYYTPWDTRVKADDCERISDRKLA